MYYRNILDQCRLLVTLMVGVVIPLRCLAGETFSLTTTQGKLERTYDLFVPASYQSGTSAPLVMHMHGASMNSSNQAEASQMNVVAEQNGFLVAYPKSVGNRWNATQREDGADDVEFIDGLIDQISADYSVDSSRVYATGFSNGGSMAFLLGNKLPHRLAAIAPMLGMLPTHDGDGWENPINPLASPTTSRPLPTLYMGATSDFLVKFNGGASPLSGTRYAPTLGNSRDSGFIDAWVANNGCNAKPIITSLEDVDSTDGSSVELFTYTECDTYAAAAGEIEAEVLFYKLNGSNHQWPGGHSPPPLDHSALAGRNEDIDGSREIWNFFSRHELPALQPKHLTISVFLRASTQS